VNKKKINIILEKNNIVLEKLKLLDKLS